jgi:hypothetical protein
MSNELFSIAGDSPQPSQGLRATGDEAKPIVLWRDRLLTLDVYQLPNQPMYVILYCPICMGGEKNDRSLRITADNKAIDFDPTAMPKIPGFTPAELVANLGLQHPRQVAGRISIEPFGCTWEAEDDLHHRATEHIGGFSVCPWNVEITNNIAKDVPRRRR